MQILPVSEKNENNCKKRKTEIIFVTTTSGFFFFFLFCSGDTKALVISMATSPGLISLCF